MPTTTGADVREAGLAAMLEALAAGDPDHAAAIAELLDDPKSFGEWAAFCQTGKNAGKPGPCPEGGGKTKGGTRGAGGGEKPVHPRFVRAEQELRREVAEDAKDHNDIHGEGTSVTERPADPVYHEPARVRVEDAVAAALASHGIATVKSWWTPTKETVIYTSKGNKAWVAPAFDGKVKIVSGHSRTSEVIRPDDPPAEVERKVLRVFRLKARNAPPKAHAEWRAYCQEGPNKGKPGPCPKGGADAPAAPKGKSASPPEAAKPTDPGDRPRPPEGHEWESDTHLAEHGKRMAEAHDADPHVRDLQAKLAATETALTGDPANVDLHVYRAKVRAALAHEARRSLLVAFGLRGDVERAPLHGDVSRSNSPQAKAWEATELFLGRLTANASVGRQYVFVRAARSRAHYRGSTIRTSKNDGPEITAHEFGHHLEEMPWARARMQAFHASRFKPDDDVPMREVAPGARYGADEVGNPDDMEKLFGDRNGAAYCGKKYKTGQTEILSMGLEQLYRDPVHFARTDPEFFGLIMGILQRGEGRR